LHAYTPKWTTGVQSSSGNIVTDLDKLVSFPGGYLEPNETPLDTAKRELLKETGYVSDRWAELGGYAVDANRGRTVSCMFHAVGCRQIGLPCAADLEADGMLLMSREELLTAISRGEIVILTQISLVLMIWHSQISDASRK
jgi:ADP-ribose pyrophosphatase